MKNLLIILSLIVISLSADVYNIKNFKSKYIGESIVLTKPFAYISGLWYCNELPEFIALNTKCLKLKESNYVLTELRNNCANCLDKKRLIKPRRLHYKENIELKVIKSYKTQNKKLSYRLFSSEIPFLLLKDKEGNKIEISEIHYEILKKKEKLNKEEKKIKFEHDNFKNYIVKTFCFYDSIVHSEKQFRNVNNLVKDFKLNDSIKIEDYRHCPPNKTRGFNLIAKDFNEYLTLKYYLSEWSVYGRWLN